MSVSSASFWTALHGSQPLLMDGASGTALLPLGLDCIERAHLSHPAVVRQLHESHAQAGARVLLTCTFQANPIALARVGLEDRLLEIARQSIRNARSAAPSCWVLGDVGPILTPGSSVEFADRDALQCTLEALEGVDGILLETCSSPAALHAIAFAQHRVAAVDGLPLLLSLTFQRDAAGRLVTRSGHAPETYARHAVRHGVTALGVNCGRDIDLADLAEILRRYRQETDLPLFVRPNAGSPVAGSHPRSPADFRSAATLLRRAGAILLGGCCGTTAAHIAALGQGLRDTDLTRWEEGGEPARVSGRRG
jgi:methionine synthase I (cobalamin-dependent)